MSDTLPSDPVAVLKTHWGYDGFRKAQRVVVDAALEGRDVLAVLPTGYGKSATFQIPALMREGTAIVISPLIALMKDQCDDAATRNIPATFVNSHCSEVEVEKRLYGLMDGQYKLFYVAPERINSGRFLDAVRAARISFLVVDEAHCASRWGHDFRPAYRNIHRILSTIEEVGNPRPPIMALTATATIDIEADIAVSVGMTEDYARIVADPVRANLKYIVRQGNSFWNLKAEAKAWDYANGRYVVYVGTRAGATKMRDLLVADVGIPGPLIDVYHGGLAKEQREGAQDRFKSGETPIVIATNAFGMGIDVPNIRSVVHVGIPGSIEDYCQEAGRAGRDGKSAKVVLLTDKFSISLRQRFLDSANPDWMRYGELWDHLHAEEKGFTFRLTAKDFSKQIQADEEHADQYGGVLNTLEAYGAVTRSYIGSGAAFEFDYDAIHSLRNGRRKLLPHTAKLLDHLMLLARSDGIKSGPATIYASKAEIARQMGISEYALGKSVANLVERDFLYVGPSYNGKTTTVSDLAYGKPITEVVEQAVIVAKRNREQARLNKMIQYCHCADRVQFIRDYFLNGL